MIAAPGVGLVVGKEPVVAGHAGNQLVLARPGSGSQWQIARGHAPTAFVGDVTLGRDDAVWAITLGADAAGHDVYAVQREGVTVELPPVDGHVLRPEARGTDAHLGAVLVARVGEQTWVYTEA